ncbi:MAG TPA: hypothetical protein VFZ59_17480 [Verrucomicrobiae bacterium]|nr:hypothetical protein [Verrucomicrobiae bacterium]
MDHVAQIAASENRSVALPVAVQIDALESNGPDALIRFHTFAGDQYVVESSTNLANAPINWNPLPTAALDGTGTTQTVTDTNALAEASMRFYRLNESR